MLTKDKFSKLLEKLRACEEAQEWFNSFDGSLEEAWEKCERGDWMLWLLGNLDADRKKMVLSACGCARLALPFNSDPSVLAAIETAEAWTKEEASLDDLDKAAEAAADEAARAAARAARAAAEAAGAAWAVAGAAWAVAGAARAAARAAEVDTLDKCADIVRGHFSFEEIIELIEKRI